MQRHGGALAAPGGSVGPWRGAAWGSEGAQQRGAARGRSERRRSGGMLRRGASWGRVWARRGAAQGCSSLGLRRAAVWGGALVGGLCRGAAAWGCAGAQRVAVQGRSAALRRGVAWGRAGAQQRGVA